MNAQEMLTNVLQTSAAVEIMNEVVLAILISSRDNCVEMREMLEGNREIGPLTENEMEDWTSLVQDIRALNHAIDYYGG